MSETATQSFPTDGAGISAADDWIERVGRDLGVLDKVVFRARLCVSELAANLREHGLAERGDFTVVLRFVQNEFEVEFADRGRPFDPTFKRALDDHPSVESASIGGRGLRLLQSMASRLDYRRDGKWNRLHLCFHAVG